jgi:gamma-glutamylputrescine oxidase
MAWLEGRERGGGDGGAAADAPDWGEPPWETGYRPPRAEPPERVDALVVGAGFAGLSAALELARSGVEVAVLEAGRLGGGASGRTGGIALEDTAAGPLPGLEGCLPGLAALLEREAIDCGLALSGCLEVAHAGDASAALAWRDGGGALFAHDRVPGGTLEPGRLLAGLARAAVRAGARVCEDAPVEELGPAGGERVRVRLRGGAVEARHVVVALNAYLARLLAPREPVRAALTLAVATEPVEASAIEALGFARDAAFYTVDLPYLWGRRVRAEGAGSSALVFGAGLAHAPSGDPCEVGLGSPDVAARLESLEERVRGLHPLLRHLRFTHRWGGPVAFTTTRRPLLGRHPGLPRAVVTGAYAGHGVALACRCGTLAARAAVRGEEREPTARAR